ncbi:MAG TPA: diaminopimelate decarboxylase [Caulobacteraceae bacterium]|nr:diaminopimelate decarboxylase [Caulobacteraceae bacterium]
MNHFELKGGELACEDVALSRIAEAVGTPVYVYSTATLERHYRVFHAALASHPEIGEPLIAFAVKANSNVAVLATLARLGAGADTVSEGEVRRALAAGVPPSRIVFSGVGKTAEELAFALEAGVDQINVESEPELDLLAGIAAQMERRATIAVRVNPEVGAGGHDKITTGHAESKFGVSLAEAERLYARADNIASLRPAGVACHIGSQIVDLAPLRDAFARMRGLVGRLRADGLAVERVDLGGGLGVPYFHQPDPPSPAAYAAMVAEAVAGLDVRLSFEPGRVIAANAGVLLARVLHVHARPGGRRFVVLDAAMNDLIRPAMYDAYHHIRPLRPRRGDLVAYDVVGPVCETGDTFTRERLLPPLEAGDLVAFMTAGAYGAAMASEYNSRPLVPEALVRGSDFALIRERPSYDDMLRRERLPAWL